MIFYLSLFRVFSNTLSLNGCKIVHETLRPYLQTYRCRWVVLKMELCLGISVNLMLLSVCGMYLLNLSLLPLMYLGPIPGIVEFFTQ